MVLRAIRRLIAATRPSWEIHICEGSEAALQLISANCYDAVATDLHMPGLDGIELLERLKLERPELVRVIHSSHVESLTEQRQQELAHAVVVKPGPPSQLIAVLDWAIEYRHSEGRDSLCS
jgi:CheY-like chemotaxis protein